MEGGQLLLVSPEGLVMSGSNVMNAFSRVHLAWALVMMTPRKLFDVDLFPSGKQTVSGWSGIGYCHMIVGYSTEFNSVYTVMKNVHYMMALICQNDNIITFHLAIYVKAKQIQWNYNVVLGKK